MHFCRICRTQSNLKYTTKQLRHIYKRQRTEEHKQLLNTTPTLGNICHDCEERLQNFHHLSDDDVDDDLAGEDSSEVDVDGSSSSGRSRATLGSQRRAESPVIVDDDELLYNLFFQKEEQRRRVKRAAERVCRGAGVVGGGRALLTARALTQHSLGSDGDTEIIEVLTSRENTPTPTPASLPPSACVTAPLMLTTIVAVPAPHQTVLAVIDLATEEEVARQTFESDDEQIVFRSVEPELVRDNTMSGNNNSSNKKCRKVYAERELRLIASLSLVSSDDESEVEGTAKSNKTSLPLISTPVSPAAVATQSLKQLLKPLIHACTQCSVRLPDAESLQTHERIHTKNDSCPVCKLGFSASQRLVHHMRRKHRTYEGTTLAERPRCAQDSAMTIRLRYLERYTYYECQLCGRIDAIFKEHKQHVMHQHAAESKSLKDPMMQELRCPICKEKCSTQYVQLACHLLSAHTPTEYRPHLREVTHTTKHKFGMNGAASVNGSSSRQKELERTARIFQFTKRRNCFFECRTCCKVVAGYLNHMQHLKAHAREEKVSDHGGKLTTASAVKAPPPQLLKKLIKTNKKKKDKLKAASANSKSQQQPHTTNNKPNHTSTKSAQAAAASAAAAASLKKQKQRQRQLNKLNKKALQSSAQVKVKVMLPLRQFRAQKYKCKHCQSVFKGFHRLNLHQLAAHVGVEYQRCGACSLAFTSDAKRVQHVLKMHHQQQLGTDDGSRRQKRKRDTDRQCQLEQSDDVLLVDENCNTASSAPACKRPRLDLNLTPWTFSKQHTLAATKLPKKTVFNADTAAPPNWLQDLLQLQQNNSTSSTTHNTATSSQPSQCRYCTHLLRTPHELSAHEEEHAARKEMQLIKRSAIGTRISL